MHTNEHWLIAIRAAKALKRGIITQEEYDTRLGDLGFTEAERDEVLETV